MNQVVENFDRSVHGYETQCLPQDALACELAKWVPFEERSGYAVEFGAGTGLFTRKVQPWCGPYLATDASPNMVATGMQRCPIVAWKVHDATDAQGVGVADWIISCSLLQWLQDPAATLRSWHGIMKPGGHLLIGVLLPGTLNELRQLLPEASPLPWHTAEEWPQLVNQAGFALERMQTWQHVEVYADALELLRAVHAMGLAPRRTVGPGRLRSAIKQYDQYFAVPGGVRSTWQAWMGKAVVV